MVAYASPYLVPVGAQGQPLPLSPGNLLPAPSNGTTARMTFGVVGPLSGPDAQVGQEMKNGAQAAIDDANAQPSGALDRYFVLAPFDDQDRPIQSALSAGYAVNDGNVIGVVGHFTGLTTDVALRTYLGAHMPLVVPATTADVVTSHGYTNVFRLPTRDSVEGSLAARFLLKHGRISRCVVVVYDGSYGGDVARTFLQEMHAAKIDASQVTITPQNVDPVSLGQQILASAPDLVYFAGTIGQLGAVFSVLAAAAHPPKFSAAQGFFSGTTTSAAYVKAAEGIVVSTSIAPMTKAPVNKLTIANFAARYGSFTPISGYAYAAMQVLIAAARRTGSLDRPSLTHALSDGTTYQTIAGDFSFLPFGDQVDPNLFFYTVRQGRWEYLDAYRPAPFAIDKG